MACTKEQVGECIRAERARRKWSRDDLAEETGIPATTIGSYENAKSGITLDNAWALADAFKMPIGSLFGRDESKYEKAN